jgi:hypothetical protein
MDRGDSISSCGHWRCVLSAVCEQLWARAVRVERCLWTAVGMAVRVERCLWTAVGTGGACWALFVNSCGHWRCVLSAVCEQLWARAVRVERCLWTLVFTEYGGVCNTAISEFSPFRTTKPDWNVLLYVRSLATRCTSWWFNLIFLVLIWKFSVNSNSYIGTGHEVWA